MAGISDIRHELCLALALWNGRDPILKERMFGLTGPGEPRRGRQGVLVVPQGFRVTRFRCACTLAGGVPLRAARRPRPGPPDPELELLDTGAFDDDRYWSVDVTYAKASPTECSSASPSRTTASDDAARAADPWFRNTWWVRRTRPRIERAAPTWSSRTTRSWGTGCTRRRVQTARSPRRCSARTRRTPRASTERRPPRRPRRMGSTTTSSRACRPSTPTASARRPRFTTC